MPPIGLRGFLLGFAIAATPGPMFFLCARRTLLSGWRAGLATGLGVAPGDGIYATLAGAGIGAIALGMPFARSVVALAGGVALVALGVLAVARRPAAGGDAAVRSGRVYVSSVGLTLANPATIASFAAVFAGLRMGGGALLVIATAFGSLAWWVVLVGFVALVRRVVDERAARVLAVVSGAALIVFGALIVARSLLP